MKPTMVIADADAVERCKLGAGAGCCAFLGNEGGRFVCMKGSDLEPLIQRRLLLGQTNAKGDLCEGPPLFRVAADFEAKPITDWLALGKCHVCKEPLGAEAAWACQESGVAAHMRCEPAVDPSYCPYCARRGHPPGEAGSTFALHLVPGLGWRGPPCDVPAGTLPGAKAYVAVPLEEWARATAAEGALRRIVGASRLGEDAEDKWDRLALLNTIQGIARDTLDAARAIRTEGSAT